MVESNHEIEDDMQPLLTESLPGPISAQIQPQVNNIVRPHSQASQAVAPNNNASNSNPSNPPTISAANVTNTSTFNTPLFNSTSIIGGTNKHMLE